MKIVCFTMGAMYPDYNQGGSQKILKEVAMELAQRDHHIEIFCPQKDYGEYELHKNAKVKPILGFKPSYPEPYYTPPYKLIGSMRIIQRALETADVFYIHDAEFHFPSIHKDVPTVVSFRDFIYPDTLVGSMLYERDELILNSKYTLNAVKDAFGFTKPHILDHINYIPNGFNLEHFYPEKSDTEKKQFLKKIGLEEGSINILYPHRPDPRKGIFEALKVIKQLINRNENLQSRVKLLIPYWPDKEEGEKLNHIYGELYQLVEKESISLGIRDNIHFHEWISYKDLRLYYSIGAATLSIGNFVESFGSNSSVESELCGTPSILSMVATQRTTLPDNLVYKINYGEHERCADIIEDIINGERKTRLIELTEYIKREYSFKAMVDKYENLFKTVTIRENCTNVFCEIDLNHCVKLPAWCYNTKSNIYHDYKYDYIGDEFLSNLFIEEDHYCPVISQTISTGYNHR